MTLRPFSGSPSEGANPVVALVQGSDGNFYGTTPLGGEHFQGDSVSDHSGWCSYSSALV